MKFILFLIISLPIFTFSQETDESQFEFYELIGDRVFVNKTVKSYNFRISKYKNNILLEEKPFIDLEMKNPTSIKINSDNEISSIQINSNTFREDLFLNFKRIYKVNEKEVGLYYNFLGKSTCDAFYVIPNNNENQSLFVDCLDNKGDGYKMTFTMSKFEQL